MSGKVVGEFAGVRVIAVPYCPSGQVFIYPSGAMWFKEEWGEGPALVVQHKGELHNLDEEEVRRQFARITNVAAAEPPHTKTNLNNGEGR